jgi:hypothetical protein
MEAPLMRIELEEWMVSSFSKPEEFPQFDLVS